MKKEIKNKENNIKEEIEMKKEIKNKENNIKEEIEMKKEIKNKENIKIVGKLEYTFDSIMIATWFKEALNAFKEDSHEGKTFVEETKCMESHLSKNFNKFVELNNYSSYLRGTPIEDSVSLAFTFCPKKQIIEFVITVIHKNDTCTDVPGSEYIYNIPKFLMDEYNKIVCPYTDADFSKMILVNKESIANTFHDKDGVLIEIKEDEDAYTLRYNGTVMFTESRKPSEPISPINPDSRVYHGHVMHLIDTDEEKDEEYEKSDNTCWYDLLGNPYYGKPVYPLNDRARLTGKYNKYIIRYIGSPSSAPTTSVTQLLMKYVFISNDVKIFRSAKTSEEIEIKKTEMKEFIDCVRMLSGVHYGITIETCVITEILLRQLITDSITSDIYTYYTTECLGESSRLVILHLKGLSNETVSEELCNSLGKVTKDIKDNQKWYDVLPKPDVMKILDTTIISNHIGQMIESGIHELIIG